MGRGGRSGGSRNPANLPRPQQISRKVSWLLRHGANQEGLSLGKGGYVNVQHVLNTRALRSLNVTFPELREVVSSSDKQRFSMILVSLLEEQLPAEVSSPLQGGLEAEIYDSIPQSEDASDYLIRANQGHSIVVDTEGLLNPITVAAGNVPETVVHGTNEQAWKSIMKSGGLRPMDRNHIHFASGLPKGFQPIDSTKGAMEAKEVAPVISGMRQNSSILIYIDITAALAADIEFFLSENGVILTGGNKQGLLPYAFFRCVERRQQGVSVLMRDGKLLDGENVNIEEWKQEVGDTEVMGKKNRRSGRGGKAGAKVEKAELVDDSRDLMAGI